MSYLKRKIAKAASKGCLVINWAKFTGRQQERGDYAVLVLTEWYPRIGFSKREAANLAYSISISKRQKLEVTYG